MNFVIIDTQSQLSFLYLQDFSFKKNPFMLTKANLFSPFCYERLLFFLYKNQTGLLLLSRLYNKKLSPICK